MRTAVLIGLAMLFAAESWASERFDLSEDAIASVQAAVTSVLKDPDSATFSDLAAAKSTPKIHSADILAQHLLSERLHTT